MNIEKLKDKIRFYETANQIHLSRADIAHVIGASDSQIKGWLDGYEAAKDIIRGAKYIKAHNLNPPTKEAVLSLENGIKKIAKGILKQGRALDARNPLSKSELFDGWQNPVSDTREPGLRNEIEGILQIALDNGQKSITVHIRGRSGHLGYLTVAIESEDFIPALEAIKETVYDHYLKITNDARNSDLDTEVGDFKDRKLRLVTATKMLGITDQKLAVVTRLRAVDDTNSQVGLSTVRSWRDQNSGGYAPDLILESLQREIQKWAHYVLFISETDAGKLVDAKFAYPVTIIENDYFSKFSAEKLYFTSCDNLAKHERVFN